MNDLKDQKCEACRKGAPLVTQKEIDELMPQIPDWQFRGGRPFENIVMTAMQYCQFSPP